MQPRRRLRSISPQDMPLLHLATRAKTNDQIRTNPAFKVASQQQFPVSPQLCSPDMPQEQQALAQYLMKIVDELINVCGADVRHPERQACLSIRIVCPRQEESCALGLLKWLDEPLPFFGVQC